MVRLAQTMHLSGTDTNDITKQIETRFAMTHVTYDVPSSASKTNSEPMVRSAQTVHLSIVKISASSKRNETSFHLSLVTLEYHWVHPK
jgi:hypothetical protein